MKINKNQIRKLVKEGLQSTIKYAQNESIYRIVKEEYAQIKGGLYEETKPHEQDRRPVDTPEDRIRLEEGNEVSRLIRDLEVAIGTVEGAMGYIDNQAALERLQKGVDLANKVWEQMHDSLPNLPNDKPMQYSLGEETKPHEADRKPADTPEDRIRK